jgi:hypothetical protein
MPPSARRNMSDIETALKGFPERRRVAEQQPEPLRSWLLISLTEQEDLLRTMQRRDAEKG